MLACRKSWFVALAVLTTALGLLAAVYLYASAVPIENDCFLAGDGGCAASTRRVWAAAALLATSLIAGAVATVSTVRAVRGR